MCECPINSHINGVQLPKIHVNCLLSLPHPWPDKYKTLYVTINQLKKHLQITWNNLRFPMKQKSESFTCMVATVDIAGGGVEVDTRLIWVGVWGRATRFGGVGAAFNAVATTRLVGTVTVVCCGCKAGGWVWATAGVTCRKWELWAVDACWTYERIVISFLHDHSGCEDFYI